MGLITAITGWVACASILAYQAFAVDKARAQLGQYRISEQTLLGLAALGGTPGAIAARQILRHKTRKEPFRTLLNTIALVQAGALIALLLAPGWVARTFASLF